MNRKVTDAEHDDDSDQHLGGFSPGEELWLAGGVPTVRGGRVQLVPTYNYMNIDCTRYGTS